MVKSRQKREKYWLGGDGQVGRRAQELARSRSQAEGGKRKAGCFILLQF